MICAKCGAPLGAGHALCPGCKWVVSKGSVVKAPLPVLKRLGYNQLNPLRRLAMEFVCSLPLRRVFGFDLVNEIEGECALPSRPVEELLGSNLFFIEQKRFIVRDLIRLRTNVYLGQVAYRSFRHDTLKGELLVEIVPAEGVARWLVTFSKPAKAAIAGRLRRNLNECLLRVPKEKKLRKRPTARVMLIDDEGRVLLFRFAFSNGALAGTVFWATPGGEVNNDESFEQAAKRELHEETGIEVHDWQLGVPVTEREFELVLPSGETVHAIEKIFTVYACDITGTSIINTNQTDEERDFLVEHRWWSADDVDAASEKIYPEDLSRILRRLER